MSWLSEFLQGGKNPSDAASPYLNQIGPMEQNFYKPYVQQGNQAGGILNDQYSQLTQDPAAFLEKLMQGYEPSRSYQLKRDEALKAAGNTAAAGGMRGSTQDIENETKLTDMLMSDDMQQWLQNVTGLFGKGLEGEQGMYNTGFDATKNLTGDLSNVLGTQGQLAFQGQANQNKSQSDLLSGLVKALGGVAGFGLPGGSTIGGNLASKFI